LEEKKRDLHTQTQSSSSVWLAQVTFYLMLGRFYISIDRSFLFRIKYIEKKMGCEEFKAISLCRVPDWHL
jgi:hypothetical protein